MGPTKHLREIKLRLESRMLDILVLLERELKRQLPIPTLEFNDKLGSCAGRSNYALNKIQLNPRFFTPKDWHTMTDVALPHEVAHNVADHIYVTDYKTRGIAVPHPPHGPLWRHVMKVLGLPPVVCHDMGGEQRVKKRLPRPFLYECRCSVHHVTQIKHERFQNGKYVYFRCRRCKESVKFVGVESKL